MEDVRATKEVPSTEEVPAMEELPSTDEVPAPGSGFWDMGVLTARSPSE
jgi:hypothetical protein